MRARSRRRSSSAALLATRGVEHVVLNARQDAQEAEIVASAGEPGRVTVATNMAGRGTDIVLAGPVREAGGLHVILTEFHESPRIDRQLFGRSGRQGDPGSVEAIVALEDELFHRYAGSAAKWLTRLAGADGRVPAALAEPLRRMVQGRAERANAQTRRAQVRYDRDMERALAFAGRVE